MQRAGIGGRGSGSRGVGRVGATAGAAAPATARRRLPRARRVAPDAVATRRAERHVAEALAVCRERGPLRGVGLVGRRVRGRVPRARAAAHPNELVGELRTAVAQPPLPHLAPARVAEAPGEGGPVVFHGAEHVAPHVRVPEDRGGGVAARRAEA
eukprot:scaffold62352_cov36-Phaeocystis_antarctica.AAC.1